MKPFEEMVNEAWNAPFSGWDFSWLEGRMVDTPLSWSYPDWAVERLRKSQAVLDMDTGGGEFFSSLAPFPRIACATEGYVPNVPIARARLEPLGVRVVKVVNNEHLPFEEKQFDLVLNRHGSYHPIELGRILKPGGLLLTQQVGGRNQMRLNDLLQDNLVHPFAFWNASFASERLKSMGFEIRSMREEFPASKFMDIGAVVYYLKAIPWQVEGFEPSLFMDRLAEMDSMICRDGAFVSAQHRFLIEARRP